MDTHISLLQKKTAFTNKGYLCLEISIQAFQFVHDGHTLIDGSNVEYAVLQVDFVLVGLIDEMNHLDVLLSDRHGSGYLLLINHLD